jgi:AcrR family transcriptional regulator
METKERITVAAVELFNRHGVGNVSSRDVSNHVGISNGNLTYHFPAMEDLVGEVFSRMLEQSTVFAAEIGGETNWASYARSLAKFADFQKEYEFFYTDILEIIRNYPTVAAEYQKVIETRQRQGRDFTARYQQAGLLNAEKTEGLYDRLQHVSWMMLTFWRSQSLILPGAVEDTTDQFLAHVFSLLIPHMTARGLKQYRQLEILSPAATS